MADNPFGTPVAGLALEMAVRNQKLLENVPKMTENQRRLINLRLQRYGGDISQYEPFMEVGYEPTVGALRSQAEGMRDYLVGLPEVMLKAMKEGEKSGVTYKNPDTTNYWQNYDRLAKMMREGAESKAATPGFGSADTQAAWSRYNQPAVAPKPTATRRLRPTRGNF
jgi:hypothetical protein